MNKDKRNTGHSTSPTSHEASSSHSKNYKTREKINKRKKRIVKKEHCAFQGTNGPFEHTVTDTDETWRNFHFNVKYCFDIFTTFFT